jgi:hypothetical protein
VWGKAATHFIKEGEELAKQQISEPYRPHRHIYSVQRLSGTSMGGERYDGRNYRIDLDKVECSCNIPQIMHAPWSHMIMVCKMRKYDYLALPYMSPLYLRSNTIRV